ncbi:ATP-dependent 6-phosphofructokinase [Aggregatilinea lenta]|uniref:ATP-dependent 6-phosphofructokinase n=1 Tax=Aggregatilinea lenta TaxID=913108 RepID=UPI000E5A252D|nr:ATP-dependent 6-phosphofructokinase [Aggregatilinea lenta]
MKRIAVLTSGGDAPGMNAAIRAVVRTGIDRGWDVYGVHHGYKGLMTGDFHLLGARDVGGIIQLGGTVLGSARAPEFKTADGRREALRELNQRGIEALVVIGGNGSQTGAYELHQLGFPVVGIGSTIDNDLFGADITIGVDTALNIALEAIDRLKVTASSHQRAFLVETMGRNSGYLALMAGIAGGAEAVVLPEFKTEPELLADEIRQAYERGKAHAIIVVAEGASLDANELAHYFAEHEEKLGFSLRVTQLGHVQRGGMPGAFDRTLATRLGAKAVACLDAGDSGVIAVQRAGEITTVTHEDAVGKPKPLDAELYELARVLAK